MRQLPTISALCACVGLLVALVMIGFLEAIQFGAAVFSNGEQEDFEGLYEHKRWLLLILPLAGACFIAATVHFLGIDGRQTGVIHAMERMHRHAGQMPLKNAILQFLGGAVALICGFSGGREGPSIHLGAATAGLISNRFHLSNENVRTLAAAGMAAGLAVVFDTPIAAFVLTLEVVILQLSIVSFLPLLVAVVSARAVKFAILQDVAYLEIPAFSLELSELFLLVIPAGIFIGLLATGFNFAVHFFSGVRIRRYWLRMLIIGFATALIAFWLPRVMGLGFDTFQGLLFGSLELGLGALALFIVIKILLTSATVGLGVPVGIIGPSLVIGAAAGALMVLVTTQFLTSFDAGNATALIIIAACAMMGTVLNCPLAAVISVLELSNNPTMTLPAVFIVAIASLTCAPLYGLKSVFYGRLVAMGIFTQEEAELASKRAPITMPKR